MGSRDLVVDRLDDRVISEQKGSSGISNRQCVTGARVSCAIDRVGKCRKLPKARRLVHGYIREGIRGNIFFDVTNF